MKTRDNTAIVIFNPERLAAHGIHIRPESDGGFSLEIPVSPDKDVSAIADMMREMGYDTLTIEAALETIFRTETAMVIAKAI